MAVGLLAPGRACPTFPRKRRALSEGDRQSDSMLFRGGKRGVPHNREPGGTVYPVRHPPLGRWAKVSRGDGSVLHPIIVRPPPPRPGGFPASSGVPRHAHLPWRGRTRSPAPPLVQGGLLRRPANSHAALSARLPCSPLLACYRALS